MNTRELYEKGLKERKNKKFDLSAAYFNEALKVCFDQENQAQILFALGVTQLQQNKDELALASFDVASHKFKDTNNKARCYQKRARIYQRWNWHSEAMREFKKAQHLYNNLIDRAKCEYEIGVTYFNNYEYKSAIKAFEKTISLLPPDYHSWMKFYCYFRIGLVHADRATPKGLIDIISFIHNTKKELGIAVDYYNKALACLEKSDYCNDLERKGMILKCRAEAHERLQEYELANSDYTHAYTFQPKLAKTTTQNQLKKFIVHFPDFFEKTLKPLLSPEQIDYAEKKQLKYEIKKMTLEQKKEKKNAFGSGFTLYKSSKIINMFF